METGLILGRVSTGSALDPFQQTTVRRIVCVFTQIACIGLVACIHYQHTNRKQQMFYLKNLTTGQIVASTKSIGAARRMRDQQPAGSHVVLDSMMQPGR